MIEKNEGLIRIDSKKRERQPISLSGEAGWEGIGLVKRELYRQSLLGVAIDEKFPYIRSRINQFRSIMI